MAPARTFPQKELSKVLGQTNIVGIFLAAEKVTVQENNTPAKNNGSRQRFFPFNRQPPFEQELAPSFSIFCAAGFKRLYSHAV
jgi:hypothetical protein